MSKHEQYRQISLPAKEFEEDPDMLLYVTELENPEAFSPRRWQWIKDLRSVERFGRVESMIHKGNLLFHINRVEFLAARMASSLNLNGIEINSYKVSRLALDHDNPEVVTADIPSPVKWAMTPEEKRQLKEQEDDISEELANTYRPYGYQKQYLKDYYEVTAKKTPEAQIVDIADKWDGLGQTLHDIRCGNESSEIFEILANYRFIFKKLQKYPLWSSICETSSYGLGNIPSDEEARAMSKIKLKDLQKSPTLFWQTVADLQTPPLYLRWLESSLFEVNTLGTFPGWQEELKEERLSFQEFTTLFAA